MAGKDDDLMREELMKSYVTKQIKSGAERWKKQRPGRTISLAVMEALMEWLPKQGIDLEPNGSSSDDAKPHREKATRKDRRDSRRRAGLEDRRYPALNVQRREAMQEAM